MEYIAFAIPAAFLLMLIEHFIAHSQKKEVHRLNDSINDISTGIFNRIISTFSEAFAFAYYIFIYQYAAFKIPLNSVLAWIVCFFAVDFFYYWYHRLSHEVNFLWAHHIVHHQSEEFNLAVALRQSAIQHSIAAWFYMPLALMGFPPQMFLSIMLINGIYQFWVHTRLIGKLGPLEWLFSTPSHHRVHHGSNPQYIDKNHGGMFIIWDRLFGTFAPEVEKVVYGITKPLKSWNPVWANLQYWQELGQVTKQTKRWQDKIKIWFSNPAWRPNDVPHIIPDKTPLKGFKYNADAPKPLKVYAALYFLSATAALCWFIYSYQVHSLLTQIGLIVYIAWTVFNLGAIFELKQWLPLSEVSRIIMSATLFLVLFKNSTQFMLIAMAIGATALLTLFYFSRFIKHFQQTTNEPSYVIEPAAK